MDPGSCDALARSLLDRRTRRGFLGVAVGVAAGLDGLGARRRGGLPAGCVRRFRRSLPLQCHRAAGRLGRLSLPGWAECL